MWPLFLTCLALFLARPQVGSEPEIAVAPASLPTELSQPANAAWKDDWIPREPFDPSQPIAVAPRGSLRFSFERGLSLRSRHIASLRRPERFEEAPIPLLDEEGYGLELWYALPIQDRSRDRVWQLGVGVRGLFTEADPDALEGCLLSLSVRF